MIYITLIVLGSRFPVGAITTSKDGPHVFGQRSAARIRLWIDAKQVITQGVIYRQRQFARELLLSISDAGNCRSVYRWIALPGPDRRQRFM